MFKNSGSGPVLDVNLLSMTTMKVQWGNSFLNYEIYLNNYLRSLNLMPSIPKGVYKLIMIDKSSEISPVPGKEWQTLTQKHTKVYKIS